MDRKLLGFELKELKGWASFVRLMNRPEDPSSLAVLRIFFGLIMLIDIPNERGMSDADIEYGSNSLCYFPLIHSLKPLPVQWMVILYVIMFIGAFGITIGFMFRLSCILFSIPYWYIFFLDKTTWNNHSYLYGLISILLLVSDANRYFSVDALLRKRLRNTHVPLWNYCLFRTQVFLVYFMAGLKKTELDWVQGYSMTNLAHHWVFDPFKLFLSKEQITWVVIHLGGLFIDLFCGFFLFFDSTRLFGTIIVSSFHLMNAQMFSIGMFPYTMLVTTAIFYSNDWPKRLARKLFKREKCEEVPESNLSPHCIYEKIDKENDDDKKSQTKEKKVIKLKRQASFYHKFFTVFTLLFISEQLFLPYSHFITKGYNNWTNGLYGYSWDMMVHSWHTQHIKIHFVDKKTNQIHFLNPKAWTSRKRWSSHGDMIYQYANCIKEKLHRHNHTDIELYMDIWRSMNHRFNQRQLDPRVDLVKAEWDPFKQTSWLMPLLTELSDWRTKIREIENEIRNKNNFYDITFVADFPGLKLENFVSKDIAATVELMNGKIVLELEVEEKIKTKVNNEKLVEEKKMVKRNLTMNIGEKFSLPSASYHTIYTISNDPSCYVYIYFNRTASILDSLLSNFVVNMESFNNQTLKSLKNLDSESERTEKALNLTLIENSKNFFKMLINKTEMQDETSEELINLKLSEIDQIFNENKFNKTKVYNDFVDKFYSFLHEKEQTDRNNKENIIGKIKRKLNSNWSRFKQSYSMVNYAIKSIVDGENFMKLVNNKQK